MDERRLKNNRIVKEYDKRKSQKEVAEMLGMSIQDVSYVTQLNNYRYTRKITPENRKDGEKNIPTIALEELNFLDKYPIENFQ